MASRHCNPVTVRYRCLNGESKSADVRSQIDLDGERVARMKLDVGLWRSINRKAKTAEVTPNTAPAIAVRDDFFRHLVDIRRSPTVQRTTTAAAGAINPAEAWTPRPNPDRNDAKNKNRFLPSGSPFQCHKRIVLTTRKSIPGVYTSAIIACDQNVYEMPNERLPRAGPTRFSVKLLPIRYIPPSVPAAQMAENKFT